MSLLTSWLASSPPDAAIEIAPDRVSGATMAGRRSGSDIQSHATEALPAGAVVASISGHNILEPAAVTAAIRAVLSRLEGRISRVALIIPDVAAKVSLVRFDQVPARRDDLDQLMRWQVRKSAPFPIDDACVSYTRGAPGTSGGGEFLVVLARRDIVEEYERACAGAGVYAGLVDLATLSALNLVLTSANVPAGDWLAVHMRPNYTSIAIVRGEHVIFFRNRPEGDEESLADLVHQTAMYYQDRLSGQGFSRVLLGGSGRADGALDDARRGLEERLGTPVEPLGPSDILTPLAGMLQRSRAESARV